MSARMKLVCLWFAMIQPLTAMGKSEYSKAQAKQILVIAEEIRSLEQAEVGVQLKTKIGELETSYEMKILRSSQKRAHIEFLGPAEERGRRMLAKGNNYWSTFPDSKKVISISRKEMIGNSAFALADIFQLDAENDYDPTIVGEEKLSEAQVLKLDLAAKHKDAPYARIEYWVEKDGYFPVKARFFGVSGKLMKTMTVESRAEIASRERPKVSKMVDEVVLVLLFTFSS